MKQLTLVFLFLSIVYNMGSAQYLSSKDSDPDALNLMTRAGQAFMTKNAQVNFKLKLTYRDDAPITSDGILYQSGKSYHLDLTEYAIISDGKTRWVYLKGANEVNIYNESNGQDWISPQDFLKLHTASDLVFILGSKRNDGVTVVDAKPLKGRFEEYSKFTIGIKNNALQFIHALSSDGTRQEMTISSITYPASWDAQKLFTFQKDLHPGVFIEDLRLD